jgi:sensor histidine kinase regulating citrate/malate metabolism
VNVLSQRGTYETSYKDEALRAAKQLCYEPEVIKRIEKTENEAEIARIMKTARNPENLMKV